MSIASLVECDEKTCNNFSHLYVMYYRHGVNPNITKGFHCAGTIQDAKKRAMKHCEDMGYKYIYVRPVVSDLKADEYYKLHGHVEGEFTP